MPSVATSSVCITLVEQLCDVRLVAAIPTVTRPLIYQRMLVVVRQLKALIRQVPSFDLLSQRELVEAGNVILFARMQHMQKAA